MRRYRIVQERTKTGVGRWVVLGESLLADHAWVDIARFPTEREASAYVAGVHRRQRDALKAEGR